MIRDDLLEWLDDEQRAAAMQIARYTLNEIFRKNEWSWFNRVICCYVVRRKDPVADRRWRSLVQRDLTKCAQEWGLAPPSVEQQLRDQAARAKQRTMQKGK